MSKEFPLKRFGFNPISQRPRLELPNRARVAVYLIVNIEAWAFDQPVPRQYFGAPGGAAVVPDVPNWSWHEYGMRVGFWRLRDSIAARGLKASAAINGKVVDSEYEPVARAVQEAGWNFMGHGYHQRPLHLLPDQSADIRRTFEVIRAYSGRPPLGWLGPGLHETPETLDHLAAAGFKFVVDWPLDDHPVRMHTKSGDIFSIPYSVEMGDLPLMVAHQHESSAWLTRVTDQFDRLYLEGEVQPRVMSMSVHPYIIGAPHRMKYFEQALDYILKADNVWFATPEEIFQWSAGQMSAPVN
ncbi:polysaccharide deacetylase family protein [Bradyrhizobium sp. TM239]|uniref:polysaccharide deacetylase family protein n=1 Tax=Bradyrhizobium sp. TM239 TaxID=2599802 RepID=UPI0030C678C7